MPECRIVAILSAEPRVALEPTQRTILKIKQCLEVDDSTAPVGEGNNMVSPLLSPLLGENRSLAELGHKGSYVLQSSLGMSAHSSRSNLSLPIRYGRRQKNYGFCGREKFTAQIHSALRGPGTPQGDKAPAVVIIQGLGGIGKTQTALNYTYRHEQSYEAVFFGSEQRQSKT